MVVYAIERQGEIYHHGIKGQKWGVRRYENEDGTLTEEGKDRYYGKLYNKMHEQQRKLNANANIKTQERLVRQHKANIKRNLVNSVVSAASIGAGYFATSYIPRNVLTSVSLGIGRAAYSSLMVGLAKYRATDIGHTKAVKKAQHHLQEMRETFKNTKYADLVERQG